MKPKDRVLTALDHKEPDRVPIDFAATPETNEMLCESLNLLGHEDLLQKFCVDFRFVEPSCKVPTYGSFFGDPLIKDYGDGRYEDIWGIQFRKIDYGLGVYYECDQSPLANIQCVEELNNFPSPNVQEIWDFSTIKFQTEENQEYAVVFDGAVLLQFCQPLRGMQQLMMDFSSNPILAQSILARVVEYWIELGTSILKAADGGIDIFTINDDYGMQHGPMFNPYTWRQYIKPLIQKAINAYKAYGVKIAFHSCGSVVSFIPDFIEMGVDILDPIQVSAKGMIPARLKSDFGDKICFRGAIDSQNILPYGSVEDVHLAVKSTLKDLARSGGYIFTSVHNIQPDVPLRNIVAMYEAVMEYGYYPL